LFVASKVLSSYTLVFTKSVSDENTHSTCLQKYMSPRDKAFNYKI